MTAGESVTMQIADALGKCGIGYLLVGAFSSNQYGVPRSTKDADFVVQVKGAIGVEFAQALGEAFEIDAQMSFETNTGTYRQIVKHRESNFKAELFLLSSDLHDQERFARRRSVPLWGREVWFPSPEDVVITKLRWARNKDKDDVRNIIAIRQRSLDWGYMERWCKQHGTMALLSEIRESVSKI